MAEEEGSDSDNNTGRSNASNSEHFDGLPSPPLSPPVPASVMAAMANAAAAATANGQQSRTGGSSMRSSSSLATLQRTPRGTHMIVKLPSRMTRSKQLATLQSVVTHLHHNTPLPATTTIPSVTTPLPPMSPLTPAAAVRSMQASASLPLFKLPASLSSSTSTASLPYRTITTVSPHQPRSMSARDILPLPRTTSISSTSSAPSPSSSSSIMPYLSRHHTRSYSSNDVTHQTEEQRAMSDAVRLLYGMRAPPISATTRELSPATVERQRAAKALRHTRQQAERKKKERADQDEVKQHTAAIQAAIARQIIPEEVLAKELVAGTEKRRLEIEHSIDAMNKAEHERVRNLQQRLHAEHDESRQAKDARRDILSLERHQRRSIRDAQRHSEQAKVHELLELQRERQLERDRAARDQSWRQAEAREAKQRRERDHDAKMAASNAYWSQEFDKWQAHLDGIDQAARDVEEAKRKAAAEAAQAIIDAELAAQRAIEDAARAKEQERLAAIAKAKADEEWNENRRIWQQRWKKHFVNKDEQQKEQWRRAEDNWMHNVSFEIKEVTKEIAKPNDTAILNEKAKKAEESRYWQTYFQEMDKQAAAAEYNKDLVTANMREAIALKESQFRKKYGSSKHRTAATEERRGAAAAALEAKKKDDADAEMRAAIEEVLQEQMRKDVARAQAKARKHKHRHRESHDLTREVGGGGGKRDRHHGHNRQGSTASLQPPMPTGGLSSDSARNQRYGNAHNSLPGSYRSGADSPPSTITPRTPMSQMDSNTARSNDGGNGDDDTNSMPPHTPGSAASSARHVEDALVATINSNAYTSAAVKAAAVAAIRAASQASSQQQQHHHGQSSSADKGPPSATSSSPGQPLDTPSPLSASVPTTTQ